MALVLGAATSALAAPTVFWGNYSGEDLSSAAAAGGNGQSLYAGNWDPFGTSVDPATGRIFWVDYSTQIYKGSLNGTVPAELITSTNVDSPYGLAFNPANDTLYWANYNGGEIAYVKPDGAGAGILYEESSTPEMDDPWSVAVDPANNRIYWANSGDGTVGYAKLDGSGGAGVITLSSPCNIDSAYSVAVDPVAETLYVQGFLEVAATSGEADAQNGASESFVAVANLDGTGCQKFGIESPEPYGLAGDNEKLYLGDYHNNEILTWSLSNLAAAPTPLNVSPLTDLDGANYPTIVDTPVGGAATASADSTDTPATLSCASSGWSYGTPSMQHYRAPQSIAYGWSRDGQAIAGATGTTLTAETPGEYSCTATATNFAGRTSATSAPVTIGSPTPDNPRLRMSIKTPKKVKAGKGFRITVKISNVAKSGPAASSRVNGDSNPTAAKELKACIKLSKGLFVVKRNGGNVNGRTICWTRSSLAAGMSATYRATVRSSKTRSGSVRVNGTATASNNSGATVKTSGSSSVRIVKPKAPKPKPPTG